MEKHPIEIFQITDDYLNKIAQHVIYYIEYPISR